MEWKRLLEMPSLCVETKSKGSFLVYVGVCNARMYLQVRMDMAAIHKIRLTRP